MPYFRKKPIVIEAMRLTRKVIIETLEGQMTSELGDWLITGINGEQYPCKPDIFEKTYEVASALDAPEIQTYLEMLAASLRPKE